MISLESHPVSIAYYLVDRYGDDLKLHFSRYYYRPQSPLDERQTFSVTALDVTEGWVVDQIAQLPLGWELAMNSLVEDGRGRFRHVPMIDFVGTSMAWASASFFAEIVGREIAKRLVYFDSGRSLHAYSPTLLSKKHWVEFMGRLLLLNIPGSPAVIDARWVGHRLVGGYSALRWSKNSRHYESMPRRLSAKEVGVRMQDRPGLQT